MLLIRKDGAWASRVDLGSVRVNGKARELDYRYLHDYLVIRVNCIECHTSVYKRFRLQ